MRLLNLKIENWACHESLDIDLSRGLQIEGRNGAGKTSILEAIRFCFASRALGYKGRVRNGARGSKVRLTFRKDNKTYLVEKTLSVEKSSTAQMLCDSTLVADNPTSVHEHLQNLFSEEIIEKLLYVPQGGLTDIIDKLGQKGGKQELDALFGLDRLEKVWQGAGEKIKENKAKLSLLTEQIVKYPDEAEKVYADELKKLNETISGLNSKINGWKEKVDGLNSKTEEVNGEIKKLREVKEAREKLRENLNGFNVKIASLKKELDSVSKRISEFDNKKSELNSFEEKVKALERFVPIRELLTELNNLLQKLQDMKAVEADSEKLEDLQRVLVKKDGAEKALASKETVLKDLENLVATTGHDVQQEEEYLNSLMDLKGKVKCPRCGQRLTEVHLITEKQRTELGVNKQKSRLLNMTAKLEGSKEVIKILREQLSDLCEKEILAKQLQESIRERKGQIEKLTHEKEEVMQKLSGAGYENETAEIVENNVNTLNNMKGKINVLQDELKQEKELIESRKTLGGDLEKLSAKKNETETKLSELVYDDEKFNQLVDKKDSFVEERHKASGEMKQCEFQVKENRTKIEDVGRRQKEYRGLKEDLNKVDGKIKLFTRARDVFHTDKGLPKFLRDRYIRHLSELLTYYFKRFNQNPIYHEISFDNDYQVQAKTTTGLLSLNQLSGGEKVQLAIALRIALIEMLSPVRLLILDEPFGSLDVDHRELLGEALNKMAMDWQLILVTHVHVNSLQLEPFELSGY